MQKMLNSASLHNFKLPLYEQVRLQIQKQLSQHRWDINQPIPTETELSEEYKVSIGTIRKAIERLVDDGILVKMQGRGTFVKHPDFSASLLRFFRYRESEGQQVIPVGIVKKLEKIDAIENINNALGLAKDEALIYIERIRVIDGVTKLSERIWLPHKLFSPLLDIPLSQFENLIYPFYYNRCNQFIVSASEKLTFIQDHYDPYLDNKKNEPLLKIYRIAKNIDSMPVEYRESWGRAINFHYEVNIM